MPSARRKPIARLSAAQARRIALAAQGFADPPADREPDGWALRRVLDRVGLIQIDSVNVLQRAHYLPLFSRLGPYDTELLDRAAHRAPRRLFEYWGHEASLLPVATQPLLRWRMERAAHDAWGGMRRIREERPELVARGARGGARRAGRSPPARCSSTSGRRRTGPWWDWSDVKRAFEWLFWSGQITSARRRGFERLYDLPERVLPPRGARHADARRSRTPSASWCGSPPRAMGVAAERDLRDYFRLPVAEARARVAELVEARRAVAGRGRGLDACPATCTRRRGCRARCTPARWSGPFDSLVWERPRVERLFGFRYRIEIYVPEAQARARLLRAAVPARRPARRARRPQGRPRGGRAARAGRARRAGRAAGDGGGARRRARARWRAGSGSAAWRCSRGAISPPRWPPPRERV